MNACIYFSIEQNLVGHIPGCKVHLSRPGYPSPRRSERVPHACSDNYSMFLQETADPLFLKLHQSPMRRPLNQDL